LSEPILRIENLGIELPGDDGFVPVVQGVSLDIAPGEVVGLAGESGSGKTMTASAVLGILPRGAKTSGSIDFGGRNLLTMTERELNQVRGAEIAMVFQDPSAALHPMLTIGRQLTEHMRVHLGLNKKQADERAVSLLEQVRIKDPRGAMKAYPHQFSGGMRQRAAIAIALACEPRIIIADEPTTALDVTVQAGILRLFDRLCRETGVAMLFITHDLGVLSAISDRCSVFQKGRVVEQGDTHVTLNQPTHPYTKSLIAARSEALLRVEATDASMEAAE
jgi:ABC-type dipeptide/oligopeptide/nickel transport system ATPase component